MGHVCRGRPCDHCRLGQGLERVVHLIGDTVDGRRDGGIEGSAPGRRRRVTAAPGTASRRLARWRRPMLPEPIRRTGLTTSDHLDAACDACYQRRYAGGRHARREVSAGSFGRSRFDMLAAS